MLLNNLLIAIKLRFKVKFFVLLTNLLIQKRQEIANKNFIYIYVAAKIYI